MKLLNLGDLKPGKLYDIDGLQKSFTLNEDCWLFWEPWDDDRCRERRMMFLGIKHDVPWKSPPASHYKFFIKGTRFIYIPVGADERETIISRLGTKIIESK